MKSQTKTVLKTAIRKAIPTSGSKVSQWADSYRWLSSSSAEKGRWKTKRAPYQRAIMDCTNEYGIREIVLMTSAQVGKTEMLQNIFGYGVHIDPAPAMLVYPTLELAESYSKNKLAPMIESTPVLKDAFNDPKSRDSGNTILHKTFVGGFVIIAGANSPTMLRSHSIKRVLMDEIDEFPDDCGGQGDPCMLAEERANTFVDRIIVKCSTPTIKDESRIEADYERSDKRKYHVPCLHCGALQVLQWKQVRFDKDNPDDAWYECEHCFAHIDHDEKAEMLKEENGACWIAEKPFKGIAGFWLNALYSPWLTWGDIVRKFLKCQNADGSFDKEKLKTFTNTALSETFEEDATQSEFGSLESRAESYPAEVPNGVVVLTAGIDVQGDRLEMTVWGHGLDKEKWVIDHYRLYGDPSLATLWDEDLKSKLTREYISENGEVYRILAAAIDTGGHNTDDAYAFIKRNPARRWYAVKGSNTYGKPIVSKPTKVNKSGFTRLNLWTVGTDTAKDAIYAGLRLERPTVVEGEDEMLTVPGYVHLPNNAENINNVEVEKGKSSLKDFIKQLTAEKKIAKLSRGYTLKVYHKLKGRRNEALDCAVYAFAALEILNPDYRALIAERQKKSSKAPAQEVDIPANIDDTETDTEPLPQPRYVVKQGSGFVHGYKKF